MVFIHDTRDKPGKHANVDAYLVWCGHQIVRSKLYCGDVSLLQDQSVCIDLKQDLQELCGNVCGQHERFRRECQRAREAGIRLIILCEHGGGITTLDDVAQWRNPRLRTSPRATTGGQLAAILRTMWERYGVEFNFCRKQDAGVEVVRLLTEGRLSNGHG